MSTLLALTEAGGAVVTALSALGGGVVLGRRSKNHHKGLAIRARSQADTTYLEFTSPQQAVQLQVEGLLVQLGPTDRAAFQGETAKTLAKAHAAATAYAAYAYGDDAAASPTDKLSRRAYIAITRACNDHHARMLKLKGELNGVAGKCTRLKAVIGSIDDIAANAEKAISGARELLAVRSNEGWTIIRLEGRLDAAISRFEIAREAVVACEFLTAQTDFAEAQKIATEAASSARGLPIQQHRLLQQADTFQRQVVALDRDISRAEAALKVALAAYADAACSGLAEELTAARLQLEHIGALIVELREDAQPQRDAWDEAEATASQLAQTVEEITAVCKRVGGTKARFDKEMRQIRADATKLRGTITGIVTDTGDRDGDQYKIREALEKVDKEVGAFLQSLAVDRPNPVYLRTRLDELRQLVSRIEDASERMDDYDDDDDDTIFRIVVGSAAAAVGLDLLLD